MKSLRIAGPFLPLISLLLITSCAGFRLQPYPGDEQGDEQLLDDVDQAVRSLMRKHDVPGLSIAVVQAGSNLVLRGYGDADRESSLPAKPDTVFRAYSISKVFTGLEIVRLAEEGLVSLDAPLVNAVPEWHGMLHWEDSGQLTLRHLLAHRGGLPRNANFRPEGGVPIADVLRLKVESLEGGWAALPVGMRYKYSNAGYNVLGRAVEVARGESFAVFMSTTALPAYGMRSSAFYTGFLPPDAEFATGYIHEKGKFIPMDRYDLNELASGNLFTTATDMAAFMTTLLETTPTSAGHLSHESLWSTYVPQFASPTDPEQTGLAWASNEDLAGERMVWHQGGDADANALVALFSGSRIGISILTNCGSYEGISLLILAIECRNALLAHQVRGADTVFPAGEVPSSGEPASPSQIAGRYVAYGKLIAIKDKRPGLRADFGPVELRMKKAGTSEMGTVYAVDHWLAPLFSGAMLPVEMDLVRFIVPPVEPGQVAPCVWLSFSDCNYEFCPRYDARPENPTSWTALEGEYIGCTVTLKDEALYMSGVGYLREQQPGYCRVVGGPFDSETVSRDDATGALSHQGIIYERR